MSGADIKKVALKNSEKLSEKSQKWTFMSEEQGADTMTAQENEGRREKITKFNSREN